jgi:mRNA-degrading endonuclease RelE of RelBE toxin-antitoxin system
MFKLIFSRTVNSDIVSSLSYIKNVLKAPMAAKDHYEELEKIYEQLKENPFSRPLVHNTFLSAKGIRFIKVKNYMLIYQINEAEQTVFLYRFMYCKRDWITILTDELKGG